MSILLLIRHGQTDGNVKHLAQGHMDIPLNETGHRQAEALSRYMHTHHPDISAIYASDLSRAHQTAQKTAERLGLAIHNRRSLRERHFGTAEGTPVADLIRLYGDPQWISAPIPEAESHSDLIARLKGELESLARAHKGEKIAIFSHGLAIRSLIQKTIGDREVPYVTNCSVSRFETKHSAEQVELRYHSIYEQLDF